MTDPYTWALGCFLGSVFFFVVGCAMERMRRGR
jgi:hypothetical protein